MCEVMTVCLYFWANVGSQAIKKEEKSDPTDQHSDCDTLVKEVEPEQKGTNNRNFDLIY